jgi:hypothetical protein
MAVADILVSPARVFYSPLGTALPDETTVAVGAAWPVGWIDLGYTLAPVSLSFSADTFELEVEQVTNPLKIIRTKETVEMETMLAELTAANLKLAMGSSSTVTTTAAGASQHGFDELKMGGEVLIPEYQWGFEGYTLDSQNRQLAKRIFIYRAVATLNGKLDFSKKAAAGIALKIKALADTTKTQGQQMLNAQFVTAWKTS